MASNGWLTRAPYMFLVVGHRLGRDKRMPNGLATQLGGRGGGETSRNKGTCFTGNVSDYCSSNMCENAL
jgi:hypothetical protein